MEGSIGKSVSREVGRISNAREWMMDSKNRLQERQLQHIGSLLKRTEELLAFDSFAEDAPTIVSASARAIAVRAADVVSSICGPESAYTAQTKEFVEWSLSNFHWQQIAIYISKLLHELYESIELGSLETAAELIHADVFGDYLTMALHLQENGYKDAAAVIAGSTLEGHLRQLSLKHGLPVRKDEGKGFLKAETLNTALGKVAYGTFDQKQVTAWLDVRNNAAHGNYELYSDNDVDRFIEWLGDFITRLPA